MKRRKRQIEKAQKHQKAAQRAQVHRILDLVMDRNEGGKTTFFEVVAHVNGVRIVIYDGKWKTNQEKEPEIMIAYLDSDFGETLDDLEAALCGK